MGNREYARTGSSIHIEFTLPHPKSGAVLLSAACLAFRLFPCPVHIQESLLGLGRSATCSQQAECCQQLLHCACTVRERARHNRQFAQSGMSDPVGYRYGYDYYMVTTERYACQWGPWFLVQPNVRCPSHQRRKRTERDIPSRSREMWSGSMIGHNYQARASKRDVAPSNSTRPTVPASPTRIRDCRSAFFP